MAVWKVIILKIILLSLTVQADKYYNCRRNGQACANSGKCNDDGSCECSNSFTGTDCGLNSGLKGKTPCTDDTDSCGSNGGLCYNNGGSKACYCPPDWYGDHCEIERYGVTCTKSAMLIMSNPYGKFSGVIYIKGHKHTAGCSFDTSGLPSGKAGLALDIEDSNCGAVTIDKDTGARSRAVIIQHNPKYVTSVDTELTVTCTVGSGTVDVTNVISTDGNTENVEISNVTDVESPVINFNIKLKDGTKVESSSSVSLDEVLTFEFNNDVLKPKMYLYGGTSEDQGRLKMLLNGEWVTVCLSSFTPAEARVACRQMGMDSPKADVKLKFHLDPVTGTVWNADFKCTSKEDRLDQCTISAKKCRGTNSIFLNCPLDSLTDMQVRLVDGKMSNEGRLEIRKDGNWFSVCGEFFDSTDAQVVCRMLGYPTERATLIDAVDIRQGSHGVWLREIKCLGSEPNIAMCKLEKADIANTPVKCEHHDDIGVKCGASTLEAIRVESCTADNKQTGETLETLKIIENSCPSSEIENLMTQEPTRSPNTTVTFQVQAFKFADVRDVSVSCTIRVCPFGTGSECDAVTKCDGGKPGVGRKRRSVDGTNVTYVRKSFTIRESIAIHPPRKPETLGETKEVTASVTTLTVAVSAVVIVILIVAIIAVVVVLLRNQANRKSKVQDANQQKQMT